MAERPMPERHKILVVDDEIAVTSLLEQFLSEKMDCLVQTAGNGVDAMAMLESTDFDLIIADILMPQMDGFDLFNHVRDLAPATRFIFMSGQFHPHDVEGKRGSGMVAFLNKPFQLKEAAKKIEEMLPLEDQRGAQWIKLFKRRRADDQELKSPLPGIDLLDLVRLIMMLHKSGTLSVWIGPVHYSLEFDQGELVMAKGRETAGREAFMLATTWPFCRHSWTADLLTGERNIKEGTESLFKGANQIAEKTSEAARRLDELHFASIPGKDVGPFHFGKILMEDEIGWILNGLIMPGEVPVLIRVYNDIVNDSKQLQSDLQTEFNYQTYIERENLAITYESGYVGQRMYTLHERPPGIPLSFLRSEGDAIPELEAAELILLIYDLAKFFYDANVVLGHVALAQIYWQPDRGFMVSNYRTSWTGAVDPNIFYYLGYLEHLVQNAMGGKTRVSRGFGNILEKLHAASHRQGGYIAEQDFLNDLSHFLKRPRIPPNFQSAKIKEALGLQ